MTDGAFSLVVRLRVLAGAVDAFLAAAHANAAASLRDEPGCRRFDVLRVAGDEHRFTFYELYEDREAFEAHRRTPHFQRWREAADRYVVEQVNEVGNVVAARTRSGDGAELIRADDAPVVDRGGGVTTTYLAAGAGLMNGTTEFPPGAAIAPHWHNCEESVVVLAGRGRFEHDGGVEELTAGDATLVPAGVAHRFVNVGEDVLRILWTYGRSDPTRTFVADGRTLAIVRPRA
ncbi:MAG TPA: antibiotic biosynthesis monooxygenase [Solirubrobacter sp.]|nr:antibiotic biosynthesis monooxygenase [Solirubrobacter sp.]